MRAVTSVHQAEVPHLQLCTAEEETSTAPVLALLIATLERREKIKLKGADAGIAERITEHPLTAVSATKDTLNAVYQHREDTKYVIDCSQLNDRNAHIVKRTQC